MWCNQMWCNHPFCQRNKTIERAVGVVVGGDRKGREKGGGGGGGGTKLERGGEAIWEGLHKIRWVRTLLSIRS